EDGIRARNVTGVQTCALPISSPARAASTCDRNPLHADADVIWGTDRTYSLRELGTVHTPRQLPRRPERSSGLGRNVTMFDTARHQVYGLHDPAMPMDDWHRVVVQHCHAVNNTFNDAFGGPLPFSEVQATASSISRWVRRNFTMSRREWHQAQAQRSNAVQRKKYAAATAALLED